MKADSRETKGGFQMEKWNELLDTATKISVENKDKIDPKLAPTVIVLKAASGKMYSKSVYRAIDADCREEQELLTELIENGDTHIDQILFMHMDTGYIDFFRFAGEIAKLDKRNSTTEILLRGAERYVSKTLEQCYGREIFE